MARKSMQYHFKDLMDALHNMSEQKALDEAKNKALNIEKDLISLTIHNIIYFT